jgi:putative ABC transport system ATP-binding protein
MALLELDHVFKRYGRRSRERVVLQDVSLDLYSGELMAILGKRDSGRSTLLQLAAGLQPPTSGVVRFNGQDLAARRGRDLGAGIGFCRRTFRGAEDLLVKDHVMVGQLGRGISHAEATSRMWSALARVDASDCAARTPADLDTAELVRVMIARALAFQPSLLVIDEPTRGVDLLERDDILSLLRSLADEGIAVLICIGEATAFAGCDRALHLREGQLGGDPTPGPAPLVQFPRQALPGQAGA